MRQRATSGLSLTVSTNGMARYNRPKVPLRCIKLISPNSWSPARLVTLKPFYWLEEASLMPLIFQPGHKYLLRQTYTVAISGALLTGSLIGAAAYAGYKGLTSTTKAIKDTAARGS